MWRVSVRGLCSLVCAFLSAVCVADPVTPPYPVNGTLGQSVSLPIGIPPESKVVEVEWKRTSPQAKIARYSKGSVEYFGGEESKSRIKLHPENFTLQISDLQREDAGLYEVIVTSDSGDETPGTVQLDVYETVSGTNISILNNTGNCNITLTCSVTSGGHINFRWWRGDETVGNDSTHRLSEYGEELSLYFTAEADDSVYRCEARNPVSEGTAQIRLGDICNVTAPVTQPLPHTTNLGLVIAGVTVPLGCIVICAVIYFRKKGAIKRKFAIYEASKDRTKAQDSSDPTTVYATVNQVNKPQAERRPPDGNEMAESQAEMPPSEYATCLEMPATLYATVGAPGASVPGAEAAQSTADKKPGKPGKARLNPMVHEESTEPSLGRW